MTTFLFCVMVAATALCVWAALYNFHEVKKNRRKLQERMDEYSNTVELLDAEKRRLEHILAEKTGLVGHLKKLITKKDNEICILNEKINKLMGDPHAEPQDPVDGGEPSVHTEPGDPVDKPLIPLNIVPIDFQDLKQSYDELAKSYDFVSRQYENPTQRYIINNLVKLYDVKSITELAKALGVSASSIVQKIKK